MRVVVGLAVLLVCLAWWLAKRYVLRGGWTIWPVLVMVPALLFTINEYRWYRFESALASAAQPVLAGRDAGFGCERLMRNFWSSQAHAGHVWFNSDGTPATSAFLSTDTCKDIKSWRKHPGDASLDEIIAVHTVSHEAAHLAGERNEARAECIALAHDDQVMQRLGATFRQAQAEVARYVAEVYPRLPDEYRTDCSALDATPAG